MRPHKRMTRFTGLLYSAVNLISRDHQGGNQMILAKLRWLRFFGGAARAWCLAALSVATGLTATVGLATPASAAGNGGVYLITPKSWGWCPNIVKQNNFPYNVAQENYTTHDSSADSGDDIIWSRVNLNQNNNIDVQVGCILEYGSHGVSITIRPTRNGQSWFISSTGATSHN